MAVARQGGKHAAGGIRRGRDSWENVETHPSSLRLDNHRHFGAMGLLAGIFGAERAQWHR
jgi:hypothetical protein